MVPIVLVLFIIEVIGNSSSGKDSIDVFATCCLEYNDTRLYLWG